MGLPEKILMRKVNRSNKLRIQNAEKRKVTEDNAATVNKPNDDTNDTAVSEEEKEVEIEEVNLPGSSVGLSVITDKSFKSLEGKVSDFTLKGIADMGFTHMTDIQAQAIPHLLEGRDLIGAAKTGSGKTLAFLLPAIELMYKLKFMPRNGTGVIILSPTRELAMQTFGILKEMLKHHFHTYGLVMGGANRTSEAQKLTRGVNILVATPGRLKDHMENCPEFKYNNLQCLIMDEADRILSVGFEEEMKKIISMLPKRRQTMLFSATLTGKVDDLIKLTLKKEPITISIDENQAKATVEGLEQGYVICPSEKRFLLLFTFLKKNRHRKVMVFFSSCMAVKFYYELLNYIDLPVMSIHGKQKQVKRTSTFLQFTDAKEGTLLCTDVAARGLDIPCVDWIVQYDPPDDPKEYIHRVGRTARGEGGTGNALLVMRPEELGFLRYLKQSKVPLNEFEFSWTKIADIQNQLEMLLSKNYQLHMSAKDGYKAYVRSYASHSLKQIFDINTLDLEKTALSFGFKVAPFVDLNVNGSTAAASRPRKRGGGTGGHQNAMGGDRKRSRVDKSIVYRAVPVKQKRNDRRQFSR